MYRCDTFEQLLFLSQASDLRCRRHKRVDAGCVFVWCRSNDAPEPLDALPPCCSARSNDANLRFWHIEAFIERSTGHQNLTTMRAIVVKSLGAGLQWHLRMIDGVRNSGVREDRGNDFARLNILMEDQDLLRAIHDYELQRDLNPVEAEVQNARALQHQRNCLLALGPVLLHGARDSLGKFVVLSLSLFLQIEHDIVERERDDNTFL